MVTKAYLDKLEARIEDLIAAIPSATHQDMHMSIEETRAWVQEALAQPEPDWQNVDVTVYPDDSVTQRWIKKILAEYKEAALKVMPQ